MHKLFISTLLHHVGQLFLSLLFTTGSVAQAVGIFGEADPTGKEAERQELAWLHFSAEHGNSFNQTRLGMVYTEGRRVPKDERLAAEWFRKAAEQGNDDGQYNLGVMYYNGQGVSRDYQQALAWYRRSAEQGNDNAQYNLGLMYFNGKGVPKDGQAAYFWWLLASSLSGLKPPNGGDTSS